VLRNNRATACSTSGHCTKSGDERLAAVGARIIQPTMSQAAPAIPPPIKIRSSENTHELLRQLLWLSVPVLAENMLHMLVGLNDTYLANHVNLMGSGTTAELDAQRAAAASAVGAITYILWFIGLFAGSIGTGSTALIARASGARHRRMANSICGQSISVALVGGCALGLFMLFTAVPTADLTRLHGPAYGFALSYLRMLSPSVPFLVVMFIANACLRGAGDSFTPAVSMIIVDVVNIAFSWGLTYGFSFHGRRLLPQMGFEGIAIGTVIAYIVGGVVQLIVLLHGRGGIRLHLHRLRPHWQNIRRLCRIGLPSGLENLLQWVANFGVLIVINQTDPSNVSSAAHINTVRIEALSYMAGFAIATGAATMVGQSLGMRDAERANRSAYLAFVVGGVTMTLCGLLFVFFGRFPAGWMSGDPQIAALTTRCLLITGLIQSGFAAAIIFGGALRGAGDTFVVMLINLASILALRLVGVLIVGLWLRLGLAAIWMVLAGELFIRGLMMLARFRQGGWRTIEV
jgi:putative MATE family efflux protein